MRFHLFLCLVLAATPLVGDPRFFGYAGVACGLDDPHDDSARTDYSHEVAGFTNLNQVCPGESVAVSASRLARAAALFTPLFHVEPFLFETTDRMRPLAAPAPYLDLLDQILTASGVAPDQMVFYLADEPALRGLTPAELDGAALLLAARYPDTPLMVIEAYRADGPPPISPHVTYWGFDAYALPDPGAEPLYTAYLDAAAARLRPEQKLVLVLDAHHTPHHTRAGLSRADMADVARATYAYALARGDVAVILGYAWAGGIDGDWEVGARDLPAGVLTAHREIGHAITGRPAP